MSARFVTALGLIVGGTVTILQLLTAFGVDLSENQQNAIGGVAALGLLVISALFSPDVPVPAPTPPPEVVKVDE